MFFFLKPKNQKYAQNWPTKKSGKSTEVFFFSKCFKPRTQGLMWNTLLWTLFKTSIFCREKKRRFFFHLLNFLFIQVSSRQKNSALFGKFVVFLLLSRLWILYTPPSTNFLLLYQVRVFQILIKYRSNSDQILVKCWPTRFTTSLHTGKNLLKYW